MGILVEHTKSVDPMRVRDDIVARMRAIDLEMQSLTDEQQKLMEDLEITEQFLAVWRRVNDLPHEDIKASNLMRVASAAPPPPQKRPKNPTRELVVAGALLLIEQAGKPLNRSELFDGLRANGLEVFGKDPQMVLSTMLWRSQEQIVRIKDHGYWPKELPYMEAHYSPTIESLIGATEEGPEDGIEEPDDDNG